MVGARGIIDVDGNSNSWDGPSTDMCHPRCVRSSDSHAVFQKAHAEIIFMPIQRVIPTQPITKLEVIGMIKSILNGRVLSVKKQSTYNNPDCHLVKFLEDRGEFQMIQVGCFIENFVQNP
jgi:hypothetical protein